MTHESVSENNHYMNERIIKKFMFNNNLLNND